MSSFLFNRQTMNGIVEITDGTSVLENGILTCDKVIAQDIQTDNLDVKNNITAGESMAIGNNVAIGNSVVCPNLYTSKIYVSTILDTKTIKTNKVRLSNNLQTYDESTVGYIKNATEIVSKPLLLTNTKTSLNSIELPIGVYMINYRFNIALSAISTPALHSITHALSTDNINGDILLKQHYGTMVFNNTLSYVTINETIFYHTKEFNASIYLLAFHNTVANGVSRVLLENIKLSALRIA